MVKLTITKHAYFNPHSPCGERRLEIVGLRCPFGFQSTLPMRGATFRQSAGHPRSIGISIHTPHAGSDSRRPRYSNRPRHSNPHSPCGERPEFASGLALGMVFQSTLPMRGATRWRWRCGTIWNSISIHTPHAGSDRLDRLLNRQLKHFNPHSPCGERRQEREKTRGTSAHFNPHSPCGERPVMVIAIPLTNCISIHTPHAGSDHRFQAHGVHVLLFQSTLPMRGATFHSTTSSPNLIFQSTLPMRGATHTANHPAIYPVISIHTPHAGSDFRSPSVLCSYAYFNPHSPCGERQQI